MECAHIIPPFSLKISMFHVKWLLLEKIIYTEVCALPDMRIYRFLLLHIITKCVNKLFFVKIFKEYLCDTHVTTVTRYSQTPHTSGLSSLTNARGEGVMCLISQ